MHLRSVAAERLAQTRFGELTKKLSSGVYLISIVLHHYLLHLSSPSASSSLRGQVSLCCAVRVCRFAWYGSCESTAETRNYCLVFNYVYHIHIFPFGARCARALSNTRFGAFSRKVGEARVAV